MASMTPSTPPEWKPGAGAERAVYEALDTYLPEDWFVFHDLGYVGDAKPSEGAIDFLIVHRTYGMLALECKGHGVEIRGDGRWLRTLENGHVEPLDESPFRQAQRHIKELVAKINPEVQRIFPDLRGVFPLIYGHAVVFPYARLTPTMRLPLEGPPEIIIDEADLAHIGERIPAILAFWGRGRPAPPRLNEHRFRIFRKTVLYPRWKLAPSFGAQLDQETLSIVRLSEEQVAVLRGMLSCPRLRVRGGAGTGKTLLALEAVRTMAIQGKRVLLTCFNIALAGWMRRTIAAWGLPDGSIDVLTFHELCKKAAERADGIPPEPTSGNKESHAVYWKETLPSALLIALTTGRVALYDVVVVDEGQDFRPDWCVLLGECLRRPATDPFVIFFDPGQDIYGAECQLPEFSEWTLEINFRNTRRIGAYVQGILGSGAMPHPRTPEGEEPVVHHQPRGKHGAQGIMTLVKELLTEKGIAPDRICILAPHRKQNSALKDVAAIAGVPLSADPLQREGALLLTTIGKFKGLESDVVILIDVQEDDLYCGRSFLYTAASRARVLLHVFEIR